MVSDYEKLHPQCPYTYVRDGQSFRCVLDHDHTGEHKVFIMKEWGD